jgi:putative flavoprotein involved in K+ transport
MIRDFRYRKRPLAGTVDCVVVGAGHSGLAMSRCLTERSIDHVVLERGEVANTWRCERWDSLRLLTPNWLSRLPGYRYNGPDPDGFMTMPEVIDFIGAYAVAIDAPVYTGVNVTAVRPDDGGYVVVTNSAEWRCRAVVIASGAHNIPVVPSVAGGLPSSIAALTPPEYRNPDQLPERGVLVVGASATGLQLAKEIHESGRPVTLAVGEHVRVPRVYRGLDIQWWMHQTGLLDERYDAVDDIVRARHVPSPQLIGTPERLTLDLNALTDMGVELVGRLAGISDGRAQFSGSLTNHCAMADLKLGRLLETIDAWAEESGVSADVSPPERFAPTRVRESPCLGLDLRSGAIGAVIWATGFRPDYSWLDVPALDSKGRLRHDGGIVDAPGMYALGLHFMRRRKSSFIHGAEDDARELCAELEAYLGAQGRIMRMRKAI